MNLLLFSPDDCLEDGRVRITGRRLQHLREIHGACAGDKLRAGEINGLMGEAEVMAISDSEATLSIELSSPPPPKLPVTLVLALPRPKMLRRILRAVAEFGVGELHLINSYRVEKSYWQTPVLEEATIRHYLLQGLEQARDTMLPAVHCQKLFKPFVEDELPGMLAEKRGLLAHPGDYPPCQGGFSEHTVLVIGPEGGFIAYEVQKLQAAGCETVSLGPRILRVENAVTALLGRFI